MRWIDVDELMDAIERDSDGCPGQYGDEWEFLATIQKQPVIESKTITQASYKAGSEQGRFDENIEHVDHSDSFRRLYRESLESRKSMEQEINDLKELIKHSQPTTRAAWLITDAWPHRVYCSACFKTYAQAQWEVWQDGSLPRRFCPNCGAVMEGGDPIE